MEAAGVGVALNPPDADLARAKTVLLAVKPQSWAEAAARYAPIAGARRGDPFHRRRRAVGRHRPRLRRTRGGPGDADDGGGHLPRHRQPLRRHARGAARAHALFEPLGDVVDLTDEDQMHAATAVSGSGPAYLFAFLETLEARAARPPACRRRKPASSPARDPHRRGGPAGRERGRSRGAAPPGHVPPAGTTEAALNVLLGEKRPAAADARAVSRAMRRSKELGG